MTLSKACKGMCVWLALLLSFKYTVQLVVNCQKIWCMEVFNVSRLNTKEYPLLVVAVEPGQDLGCHGSPQMTWKLYFNF